MSVSTNYNTKETNSAYIYEVSKEWEVTLYSFGILLIY